MIGLFGFLASLDKMVDLWKKYKGLERVLLHELGHATMVSYGMLPELHRMVRPAYWTEAEEWICNLLADYGAMIFRKASDQLGYDILEWQPPYARDGIA